MRELVPLAAMLGRLAGGYQQAVGWLDTIGQRGASALQIYGISADATLVFADRARAVGLLHPDGTTDRVRLAQLLLVIDILSAVPVVEPVRPEPQPLVFTVPPAAGGFVTPSQRLDVLVTDVIARSDCMLHVGGPFWNDGGWDLLRPVMLPALEQRGVTVTFYLHPHEWGRSTVVARMVTDAREHAATHGDPEGRVRVLWWMGGEPSLMHAKFVVADRAGGYFGTANLTSFGLGEHFEMGVALAPEQAATLVDLLDSLERAGLFTSEMPVA